jgi:hypothetical protein
MSRTSPQQIISGLSIKNNKVTPLTHVMDELRVSRTAPGYNKATKDTRLSRRQKEERIEDGYLWVTSQVA